MGMIEDANEHAEKMREIRRQIKSVSISVSTYGMSCLGSISNPAGWTVEIHGESIDDSAAIETAELVAALIKGATDGTTS
jgi:hypothetical protein